jgi:hypothetical protein
VDDEPSIALFAVAGALGTAVMIQATAAFSRRVPDHGRAQALGLQQSGLATIQGLTPLLAGSVAGLTLRPRPHERRCESLQHDVREGRGR